MRRRKLKVSEGGKPLRKAALIVKIAAADKGQTSVVSKGKIRGSGGVKLGAAHEAKGGRSAAPEPGGGQREARLGKKMMGVTSVKERKTTGEGGQVDDVPHERGGLKPGGGGEVEGRSSADPRPEVGEADKGGERVKIELVSGKEENKIEKEEGKEEDLNGRGRGKPGGRAEVEGLGGAAPRPWEVDRSIGKKIGEASEEARGRMKKQEPGEGEEEGEEKGGRGRYGSGGHKPGGELEMMKGQYLELETGETGLESAGA